MTDNSNVRVITGDTPEQPEYMLPVAARTFLDYLAELADLGTISTELAADLTERLGHVTQAGFADCLTAINNAATAVAALVNTEAIVSENMPSLDALRAERDPYPHKP